MCMCFARVSVRSNVNVRVLLPTSSVYLFAGASCSPLEAALEEAALEEAALEPGVLAPVDDEEDLECTLLSAAGACARGTGVVA